MLTKSGANESKSCRIHHMQWLKWPFRIPPIHNTEAKLIQNFKLKFLSFFFSHQPNRGLKKKRGNKKVDQVSAMEANLASSRSFKEEARWNPPVEEEEEALEKSL